jgi:uncharacterized membrane protein
MRWTRPAPSAERGSIAPLAIGLALLSLATILVASSASSLFLLERRLTSLAEFAALNSAESGMTAGQFVEGADPRGFMSLVVARDEVVDGVTSEVILCAKWIAPLPSFIQLGSRDVCGHGAARAG